MGGFVLIAGESWTVHAIQQKGFDSFTTTERAERVEGLRAVLEGRAVTFTTLWMGIADWEAAA
jgi:uncharacterized membrane protein